MKVKLSLFEYTYKAPPVSLFERYPFSRFNPLSETFVTSLELIYIIRDLLFAFNVAILVSVADEPP